MADIKIINKKYTQSGSICVLASYAIVIDYFSSNDIQKTLTNYMNYANLSDKKNKKKNHELISNEFHNHCIPLNKRGFDYIVELHNGNDLDTGSSCKIIDHLAQLTSINQNIINTIKETLKENETLAMILFKSGPKMSHAVVVGWDDNSESYFYRDPERKGIIKEDIFINDIQEYILFQNTNSD